ncbi:MAG TPA: hypothetical protein VMW63_05670 [Methanoregulaceae archaeon]|nr:hypothetical protein [Methanoregulaceae archaeon]
MREIVVVKTEENGTVHLAVRFKSPAQLHDGEDPAPLPEKELTNNAEDAIGGYMDEFSVGKPVRLTIELPEGAAAPDILTMIPESIRHHFAFRSRDLDHEILLSKREGMYSVLLMILNIIIAVIFVCNAIDNLDSIPIILLGGLITILNWVTIWDTYEHFVYDHRNLLRKKRLFEKIIQMPIEVREF